jgi:hypothetical protein
MGISIEVLGVEDETADIDLKVVTSQSPNPLGLSAKYS